MDNIDFQDFDFSSTNRSRIKTCSKCKSAEHTITKCPMNPCGYCKLPGHISSSCLVKKQDIQALKRIRNMSPEKILRQRENDLAENLSAEQVEQQRIRHLAVNLSLEQIQRHRENNVADNMSPEEQVELVIVEKI